MYKSEGEGAGDFGRGNTYGVWRIWRTIHYDSPFTQLIIVGQADFHTSRWVFENLLILLGTQEWLARLKRNVALWSIYLANTLHTRACHGEEKSCSRFVEGGKAECSCLTNKAEGGEFLVVECGECLHVKGQSSRLSSLLIIRVVPNDQKELVKWKFLGSVISFKAFAQTSGDHFIPTVFH